MLNRSTYHGLVLCIVFLLQTFLSGCGYMILSRKSEFVPLTEGTTVSIAENKDGPYKVIESKKIKLNHFKKSYWLKQEKEGHVSRTQELTRTTKNRMKRLDIAILMPTAVFASIFTPIHFLSENINGATPNLGQKIALFTALGTSVLGWAAVIPCPGYIYAKKLELPKLVPILTKDSSQLFLTVGKNEFKLNKRGVRVHDYPTMKQFTNGYGYESRDTVDLFNAVEKLDLYKHLSDMLIAAEYGVDSAQAKLDETLKIDSWPRSVVFATADDKLRCELRVSWALETVDEMQYLYDKSMNGNSDWLPFKEDSLSLDDQNKVIAQAFDKALDMSFKKFIAMDTIQAILNAPVPIPLQDKKIINLETGNLFSITVSEAVKSVITVVTKNGHGSGCVITPDGYIITNAHVVEDDTTELMAIMGNNVKKKIPLKFVRMNEPVDLALLKLDTSGLTPLKLATADQIETGADAYAIGTPADIDLGQTVTRGIISGKRKFGGHQLIQTDVAISPGNSGGALIRPDGIIMGIVTSALDRKEVNDIGFAIPAPLIESALKINLKNQ